jgi:hypothetical protein
MVLHVSSTYITTNLHPFCIFLHTVADEDSCTDSANNLHDSRVHCDRSPICRYKTGKLAVDVLTQSCPSSSSKGTEEIKRLKNNTYPYTLEN